MLTFGVDDPAARARDPAACCRLEVLRSLRDIRTSTRRRTSDISATIAVPRAVTSGRRSTSRRARSSSKGWRDRAFGSTRPTAARASSCRFPGSTTSTTPSTAASVALALASSPAAITRGLADFSAAFGRFERIPVGAKAIVVLLIKNPAAANEALRLFETGVPPVLLIALNDEIADGQDVSWIWDVDFEPLLPHVGRVVASGESGGRAGVAARLRGAPGGATGGGSFAGADALDRGLELVEAGTELVILPTYTAMLALRAVLTERGFVQPYWDGADAMKIRVGHLYPEYLNIYADRGNIAVLARRAALRGYELAVEPIGLGERVRAGSARSSLHRRRPGSRAGADCAGSRRQRAPICARRWPGGRRCSPSAVGTSCSDAGYRGRDGSLMPGAGLFGHETVAGSTRMIGDVLLECELEPGAAMPLAGFENHAGRTVLDSDASPLGRVVHGFGNDGESGFEGCRFGRAIGTYLHGPLLPRNPWLADWLLAQALGHAQSSDAPRARAASRRARGGGVPGGRRSCSQREADAARSDIPEGHPIPPPTAIVSPKSSRVGNALQRMCVNLRRDSRC